MNTHLYILHPTPQCPHIIFTYASSLLHPHLHLLTSTSSFTSSYLPTHILLILIFPHLHTLTSPHFHILTSTSSPLLTFTSSPLLTSPHLHIFTSPHLHILTSPHLHILTSPYLHILTSTSSPSHPHLYISPLPPPSPTSSYMLNPPSQKINT